MPTLEQILVANQGTPHRLLTIPGIQSTACDKCRTLDYLQAKDAAEVLILHNLDRCDEVTFSISKECALEWYSKEHSRAIFAQQAAKLFVTLYHESPTVYCKDCNAVFMHTPEQLPTATQFHLTSHNVVDPKLKLELKPPRNIRFWPSDILWATALTRSCSDGTFSFTCTFCNLHLTVPDHYACDLLSNHLTGLCKFPCELLQCSDDYYASIKTFRPSEKPGQILTDSIIFFLAQARDYVTEVAHDHHLQNFMDQSLINHAEEMEQKIASGLQIMPLALFSARGLTTAKELRDNFQGVSQLQAIPDDIRRSVNTKRLLSPGSSDSNGNSPNRSLYSPLDSPKDKGFIPKKARAPQPYVSTCSFEPSAGASTVHGTSSQGTKTMQASFNVQTPFKLPNQSEDSDNSNNYFTPIARTISARHPGPFGAAAPVLAAFDMPSLSDEPSPRSAMQAPKNSTLRSLEQSPPLSDVSLAQRLPATSNQPASAEQPFKTVPKRKSARPKKQQAPAPPSQENRFSSLEEDSDDSDAEDRQPARKKKPGTRKPAKQNPKNAQPISDSEDEPNIGKPAPIHIVGQYSDRAHSYCTKLMTKLDCPAQLSIRPNSSRIRAANLKDHMTILNSLKASRIQFHTYGPTETKRFIARGVPTVLDEETILHALKSKNIEASKVIRFTSRREDSKGKPLMTCQITTAKSTTLKELREKCPTLTHISVTWERYRGTGKPPICGRCQSIGHNEKNCNRAHRCGICGEDHPSVECIQKRERNEDVTIHCANCNSDEHQSVYKGCPMFKKWTEKQQAQRQRNNNSVQAPNKQAPNNMQAPKQNNSQQQAPANRRWENKKPSLANPPNTNNRDRDHFPALRQPSNKPRTGTGAASKPLLKQLNDLITSLINLVSPDATLDPGEYLEAFTATLQALHSGNTLDTLTATKALTECVLR